MTAVDNTIIHQMLEISGPQNFRELDGPAVLLVRQPLACMDATGRSNAVSETVKATVTGWVSISERTHSTLLAGSERRQAPAKRFSRVDMNSEPAGQNRELLPREGADLSCKRNCCLTKETGEHNIDLIGTECSKSECVRAC